MIDNFCPRSEIVCMMFAEINRFCERKQFFDFRFIQIIIGTIVNIGEFLKMPYVVNHIIFYFLMLAEAGEQTESFFCIHLIFLTIKPPVQAVGE